MPRRSFNNVFVAVNTVSLREKPISWLPNPTWPAATDGNCYFRTGEFSDSELFHHLAYSFESQEGVRLRVSHTGGVAGWRCTPTAAQQNLRAQHDRPATRVRSV
jgi:hypothetical protein